MQGFGCIVSRQEAPPVRPVDSFPELCVVTSIRFLKAFRVKDLRSLKLSP